MPRQAGDPSRVRSVRSSAVPNAFGTIASVPAPFVRISLMVVPGRVRIRPSEILAVVGARADGAAWSEGSSLHPFGAEHTGLAVIVDGVGSPTGARHSGTSTRPCHPVRLGRPASRLRSISLTTAVHSRMGRTAHSLTDPRDGRETHCISGLVCSTHSQYVGKVPVRSTRLTSFMIVRGGNAPARVTHGFGSCCLQPAGHESLGNHATVISGVHAVTGAAGARRRSWWA